LHRFETGEMTETWWMHNIKSSVSKLIITCKDCDYKNILTSIHSVQQGRTPGCWCNGGQKMWPTEHGRLRLLSWFLVGEDRYQLNRFDIDEMDHDWWMDNISSNASTIIATCRDCGFRNTVTTINNIQQKRVPGCWCNGGAQWSSKQGWQKCLAWFREDDQRPQLRRFDTSNMTWEWWQQNVRDAKSTINVLCTSCSYANTCTNIDNVHRNGSVGCWCNGGAPRSSNQGWRKCLAWFQEDDQRPQLRRFDTSEMTWNWWQSNIKGNESKINVICTTCGFVNKNTCLGVLQQMHEPSCWCNGGQKLWCTEWGWQRCLALFKCRSDLQRFDVSELTWDWWQTNVRNSTSRLTITCTVCGYKNDNARIPSVQQNKPPGCQCRHKTEKKLFEWLCSSYGASSVRPQATWPELVGRRGRLLRCDFYLESHGAVIELDGHVGHFGRDWRGGFTLAPARRDLRKERFLVAKGITVIRLLQPDVWQDSWDWQNFLTQTLNEAQAARRGRVVLQPGAREYADPQGVYAELRLSAARRSLRRRLWRGAFATGRDERP